MNGEDTMKRLFNEWMNERMSDLSGNEKGPAGISTKKVSETTNKTSKGGADRTEKINQ